MDINHRFILALFVLVTITVACSDDDGFLGASNASDMRIDDMNVELDATVSDDLSTTVDASSDLSMALDTGQPVEDAGADSGPGASDMDGDSGSQGTDMSDDDAGVDQGNSKCSGQAIGQACSGRDCPSPYTCEDGRCVPGSGRPICGGVAGAICTTRAFPECSNFVGADFGPCLSSDEKECACEVNSDLFTCIEN